MWPFPCSSSGCSDGSSPSVSTGPSLCQAPREALGVCCASGAGIPTVLHLFNSINYCCSSNRKPEACDWNESPFKQQVWMFSFLRDTCTFCWGRDHPLCRWWQNLHSNNMTLDEESIQSSGAREPRHGGFSQAYLCLPRFILQVFASSFSATWVKVSPYLSAVTQPASALAPPV